MSSHDFFGFGMTNFLESHHHVWKTRLYACMHSGSICITIAMYFTLQVFRPAGLNTCNVISGPWSVSFDLLCDNYTTMVVCYLHYWDIVYMDDRIVYGVIWYCIYGLPYCIWCGVIVYMDCHILVYGVVWYCIYGLPLWCAPKQVMVISFTRSCVSMSNRQFTQLIVAQF